MNGLHGGYFWLAIASKLVHLPAFPPFFSLPIKVPLSVLIEAYLVSALIFLTSGLKAAAY